MCCRPVSSGSATEIRSKATEVLERVAVATPSDPAYPLILADLLEEQGEIARANRYRQAGEALQVAVRKHSPATSNPEGPGTGIELPPTWRRGHWRAYPGQGAARARGEQVPLLFVRPCLVRRDRLLGEVSDTEATYSLEE